MHIIVNSFRTFVWSSTWESAGYSPHPDRMAAVLHMYFIHQGMPSADSELVPPAPGNSVFFTASIWNQKHIFSFLFSTTNTVTREEATEANGEYNDNIIWHMAYMSDAPC